MTPGESGSLIANEYGGLAAGERLSDRSADQSAVGLDRRSYSQAREGSRVVPGMSRLEIGRIRGRSLIGDWASLTIVGTLLVTTAEALLLQRKLGYFTGGFLAQQKISTIGQLIGFLGASVLADAAVIGGLVCLGLWLSSRLDLGTSAARLVALCMALLPIAAYDFVEYSLLEYLGDAFDLTLMFDLVNRRPQELAAVSAAHLVRPFLIVIAASCLLAGAVWFLKRRQPPADPSSRVRAASGGKWVAMALIALASGLFGTTALRLRSEVIDLGVRRKPSAQVLGWLVTGVSDVDRDGYGLLSVPADPDPWDRRVFPFAVDHPGNGLDEDGLAGDLLPGDEYKEGAAPVGTSWPTRPDIVLIVLESFRADTVGARLNQQPVTPVLDDLAARGISAQHAYSINGFTVASRFHLLSGSLANLRGATSLIDDFKAHGYEVAYFSAQDESFGEERLSVDLRGADVVYDARVDKALRYSTFTTQGSLAVPYTVLQRRVADFLRKRAGARPLFLYVNYHDTHFPYHHDAIRPLIGETVLDAAQIRPSRAADLKSMYLNTAANVDRAIGELLETARASRGTAPGVIVTADHGESLFDEGYLGHGYVLNDTQTRIPLIVSNLPLVVEEPFGQSELRDALRRAVEAADSTRQPVLKQKTVGGVFQYLGALQRPRQVGIRTLKERTVFDFRTGRFRINDGTWERPETLATAEHEKFLTLVRFWERVRVAQATNGSLRGAP